ncbi:MAG: hypothetical protein AAGC77_03940 [Pseudomonadota bacterium]
MKDGEEKSEKATSTYDADNIALAVMTLAYEVWTLRDRVMTLEEILEEKGVPVSDAIEHADVTPEQQAKRDAAVKEFSGRIIAALSGIPPKNPDL